MCVCVSGGGRNVVCVGVRRVGVVRCCRHARAVVSVHDAAFAVAVRAACAHVCQCQPPARVLVRATACLQWWCGHTHPGDATWASPTGKAFPCVPRCACSQVCSLWVLGGDEWLWGMPTHVQCCTHTPPILWQAVHPRLRVLYTPSHGSPAAVELVPGMAKVNSAGARRHCAGKL